MAGMRIEGAKAWDMMWHLYAMSDNALTAAQLANRLNIPEEGVVRLMNTTGAHIADQTGWFPIPNRDEGWQILFCRTMNPEGEWVYSLKDKFLPILATQRKK